MTDTHWWPFAFIGIALVLGWVGAMIGRWFGRRYPLN